MPVMAVLANGQRPVSGRRFRSFLCLCPIKIEYAIDRFAMETKRLLDVLDKHLAKNEYVVGGEYTIADMAIWPWYASVVKAGPIRRRSFCRFRSTGTCCDGPI